MRMQNKIIRALCSNLTFYVALYMFVEMSEWLFFFAWLEKYKIPSKVTSDVTELLVEKHHDF